MSSEVQDVVFVCKYTDFDNLAHQPRGTPAEHGLTSYALNSATGELNLLQQRKHVLNPSFCRVHTETSTLYTCTESIEEDGLVYAYEVDVNGNMATKSMQSANGTSTCYLTLDEQANNLLFVNYWDSSMCFFPIDKEGSLLPVNGFLKPKKVNSRNREDHLHNRQLEDHAHAIVLDPFHGSLAGRLAYVPDLGLDIIKQYRYIASTGEFEFVGSLPSAEGPGPHGPRYIEFHPVLHIAYVVNELSSLISVFKYEPEEASKLSDGSISENGSNNWPGSLQLLQTISTVPEDYDGYNTCGRICCTKIGDSVLVSNRGHDSIAVYEVNETTGLLEIVNIVSTEGETPRHFQLNEDDSMLIAANQDSDNLAVFTFNNRDLVYTGVSVNCKSPNFVQFVRF